MNRPGATRRRGRRPAFTRTEFLVVTAVLLGLLACLGVTPPLHALFLLVFGWIPYALRVLPEVTVSPSGVVTAALSLAAVTVGVHLLGRWWMRNANRPAETGPADGTETKAADSPASLPPPPLEPAAWPARRTCAVVGLILSLFVAGLSGTGVAHQSTWLLTSPEPLLSGGSEAARRSQSRNNLKQFGLALHNYHDTYGFVPPAGTFDETGRGHHSWVTALLPNIEHRPLYERIDHALPWDHPANAEAVATPLPVLRNPGVDRGRRDLGPNRLRESHYAANSHLFGTGPGTEFRAVADGLANTIFVGEAAGNFKPWADPSNVRDPTLGVKTTADGFGSPWRSGTGFLMGDGSVRFVSDEIDPAVLRAIATPAGGEPVGDF